MKTLKVLAALAIFVLAGVAVAELVNNTASDRPSWFQKGLYVGSATAGPGGSSDKITRVRGASTDYDFAAIPAGYVSTLSLTVGGSQRGDPCFAGAASQLSDAGSPFPAEAKVDCVVDVAGTVILRVHADFADAGDVNPPDAGYFVRVISSQ